MRTLNDLNTFVFEMSKLNGCDKIEEVERIIKYLSKLMSLILYKNINNCNALIDTNKDISIRMNRSVNYYSSSNNFVIVKISSLKEENLNLYLKMNPDYCYEKIFDLENRYDFVVNANYLNSCSLRSFQNLTEPSEENIKAIIEEINMWLYHDVYSKQMNILRWEYLKFRDSVYSFNISDEEIKDIATEYTMWYNSQNN